MLNYRAFRVQIRSLRHMQIPVLGARLSHSLAQFRDRPLDIRQERSRLFLSDIEGKCQLRRICFRGRLTYSSCRRSLLSQCMVGEWRSAFSRYQRMLQIGQGSLYPALYRLEYKGWIKSEWGNSENNRRAKFYRLTAAGRRQLETELETWDRLSSAIGMVLGRTAEASR